MFEKIVFSYLEKERVLPFIGILSLLYAAILVFTYYTGLDMIFAIVFFSIALTYPTIKYLSERNLVEFHKKINEGQLIMRHLEELFFFLIVLIITTIGTYIGFNLGIPGLFQGRVSQVITGYVTFFDSTFIQILVNNLNVFLLTLILSLIFRSAFLFIITWNSSLIAYYLYTIQSPLLTFTTSLSLLAHGLLEIAGYIFVGFGAFLFSLKVENKSQLNKQVVKDIVFLFLIGLFFVLLGALIEVV